MRPDNAEEIERVAQGFWRTSGLKHYSSSISIFGPKMDVLSISAEDVVVLVAQPGDIQSLIEQGMSTLSKKDAETAMRMLLRYANPEDLKTYVKVLERNKNA